MAQITIYLPDEIESKVRKAAKARRTSVSRWIADQVLLDASILIYDLKHRDATKPL